MNVLVACEESQEVCKAFREHDHLAYSCDIMDCSGGHLEWHIKDDVIPLLNGNCSFETCDGIKHFICHKWDLIIAFPPCTYLTSAGTRHYSLKCNSLFKVEERKKKRFKAYKFFMEFVNADCEHIAIENPVGYMNSHFRKPDQIIHPYYFGDPFLKRTCLWLKNLPKLHPTNMLNKPEPLYINHRGKKIYWVEGLSGIPGGNCGRAYMRSKTFPGIAQAMVAQWSVLI